MTGKTREHELAVAVGDVARPRDDDDVDVDPVAVASWR